MPGRDQTGPKGDGPLTGGGWGRCRRGAGRGRGQGGGGRGQGFGGGRGFGAGGGGRQIEGAEDELSALKGEVRSLNQELKAVQERIAELDSTEEK